MIGHGAARAPKPVGQRAERNCCAARRRQNRTRPLAAHRGRVDGADDAIDGLQVVIGPTRDTCCYKQMESLVATCCHRHVRELAAGQSSNMDVTTPRAGGDRATPQPPPTFVGFRRSGVTGSKAAMGLEPAERRPLAQMLLYGDHLSTRRDRAAGMPSRGHHRLPSVAVSRSCRPKSWRRGCTPQTPGSDDGVSLTYKYITRRLRAASPNLHGPPDQGPTPQLKKHPQSLQSPSRPSTDQRRH
jgi:hypothetical protein